MVDQIGYMCNGKSTQQAVEEAMQLFRQKFGREPETVILNPSVDNEPIFVINCLVEFSKFILPRHAYACEDVRPAKIAEKESKNEQRI
jgi:hypothetical protein